MDFKLDRSAPEQNYISTADISGETPQSTAPASGKREHTPLHCVCHALGCIGATLTFIRNFIANAVMLLILALIAGAWYLGSTMEDGAKSLLLGGREELPEIHSPVLYMPLRGYVSEMPSAISDMGRFSADLKEKLTGIVTHELITIEKTLREAALDDEIEEVLINTDGMGAISQDKALRITAAMDEFREASTEEHPKTITAIGTQFSHSAYLIASHASRIVLDPMGSAGIRGMTFSSLYFRDLLARFKVQPYIFRAGEFKSAVEPFLRQDMSSEVRAEYTELAAALWQQYYEAVAAGRSALAGGSDKLLPDSKTWLEMLAEAGGSESALDLRMGLVDELRPLEEVHLDNVKRCGSAPGSDNVPNYIHYLRYAQQHDLSEPDQENKVAVLYGLGEITDYSESRGGFTPDNLVPLIREAAEDDEVKAMVLYLNSGGGSVIASEKIRRSLTHFKEKGKKLVVSMNGTAASGAYWIASTADKILATPATITGSIGVFGISFGVYGLLNEYGVSQDGISTHDLADVAVARPLNPVQHQQVQLTVESTYKKFVDLVCRERGLDPEDYKKFAEGRVFLAGRALELGLIDAIGTYEDALDAAVELAELDRDATEIVQWVPEDNFGLSSFREVLLKGSSAFLPAGAAAAVADLLESSRSTAAPQPELMAVSPVKAPEF